MAGVAAPGWRRTDGRHDPTVPGPRMTGHRIAERDAAGVRQQGLPWGLRRTGRGPAGTTWQHETTPRKARPRGSLRSHRT